ncbi:hypothetical protein TNCV_2831451 [Trichonephila clavipes]|nr:hypothetical protein TNCV_2831451 [Trichonephila clavipes]
MQQFMRPRPTVSISVFNSNVLTSTVHNFWPVLQILDGASAVYQDSDTVLIRVESMIEKTTNSNEFRSKDEIGKRLDVYIVQNYVSRATVSKARDNPRNTELHSLQFFQVCRRCYLKDLVPIVKDWANQYCISYLRVEASEPQSLPEVSLTHLHS